MKVLEISKKELIHNINIIKKSVSKKTRIIGVVKGNGYGIGLLDFTNILIENGIDMFAVATTDEALELRNNGIKHDILMLSSISTKEDIEKLIESEVILTVGSKETAKVVNELSVQKKKQTRVHIKIDTGFGRYGFVYNDIPNLVETIKKDFSNLNIEGTFTHFSEAYAKKTKWTSLQYERFLNVVENLKLNNIEPGMLHVCNSSAFIKFPYMKLDAVRIGSAFTGRISVPNTLGLKRIGILKTKVEEVKMLPKGYNIGYSNMCKLNKQTKVAIIPVGYLDGVNMSIDKSTYRFMDNIRYIYNDLKAAINPNKLSVIINNKRYYTLGLVGMYNLVIDTRNDNIKIGDNVFIDTKILYINNKIRREYI